MKIKILKSSGWYKNYVGDEFEIRNKGDYGYKSFWLSPNYNWEIKEDRIGQLCLVPTKKK